MPSLGAARRSSGSPPTKSRLPWSSVAGGRVALFLFELLERVIGVTANMVGRHRRRRLRGITRTAAQAQHHQYHHAQSQSPVSYSFSLHRLPLAHRMITAPTHQSNARPSSTTVSRIPRSNAARLNRCASWPSHHPDTADSSSWATITR